MKIVLLGPPGAGKGTQAKVLTERLELCHVSTGDLLRAAVKNESELGKKAYEYMRAGELVPDDIIINLVDETLSADTSKKGFVLDGFPRTEVQAKSLDDMLASKGDKLNLVVYMNTSKDVVISRLCGRRVCGKCGAIYHVDNMPPQKDGICDKCSGELVQRPDDQEATILNRLEVYQEQTAPLIDYYRQTGLLRECSGDLNVDALFTELRTLFEKEGLFVL